MARLQARPVVGGPSLPRGITGINKKAWEYVWVRFEDKEGAGALVKQPVAVYVEEVYEEGDVTGLEPPAP